MKNRCLDALIATLSLSMIAAPVLAQAPPDPPEEEIQAAIAAFDALGGRIDRVVTPYWSRYASVSFKMPVTMNDGDLKKLPKVSFPFGLCLFGPQVTDQGLKELATAKNMIALELSGCRNVTGKISFYHF